MQSSALVLVTHRHEILLSQILLQCLQLVTQILIFVMFFLLLCGTYLFRVGLIGLLSKYANFKSVIGVASTYILLTGIVGGLRLTHISSQVQYYLIWNTNAYTALSVIQKLFACLYYVVLLRTSLTLGDASFYTRVSTGCVRLIPTYIFPSLHCSARRNLCTIIFLTPYATCIYPSHLAGAMDSALQEWLRAN